MIAERRCPSPAHIAARFAELLNAKMQEQGAVTVYFRDAQSTLQAAINKAYEEAENEWSAAHR